MKNTDYDAYLFHQGTNYNSQSLLGVHRLEDGSRVFRVWAPNAYSVALTGDFIGWDKKGCPLERITEGGIWETTIKAELFEGKGKAYKYIIEGKNGRHLKSDPYALYSETMKNTASLLFESSYVWRDAKYMSRRRRSFAERGLSCPFNTYELHLGSWHTREGLTTANGENYLTYRETAELLIPYLTEMGYTHVEFLPVMEHPFDGSWGYQITSFFAPSSRYGSPDDLKYLIDSLHCAGIGVIFDWVPAHFPKDEAGLYEFDGQPLYEYQGRDRMEHKVWNTRFFDLGRSEIQSFLISNALYWINEFHIDGLRFDAVAAMLYLDFDRSPGEWIPNEFGGNLNLEAVAFLKKINSIIKQYSPDVLTIAEESTHYDDVTKPLSDGGLGFDLKWNMGWANDMFDFIRTDPLWRGQEYKKLNFSFMYCFNQQYMLTVSHDEVCHGKKSLIDKNFGSIDDKFDGIRLFLAYMTAHPGKKMLFMGSEYGQFREWDYTNPLEWFMLDYPNHAELQKYTASLNHFYLNHSQLWEDDFSWNGTKILQADDPGYCVLAFERFASGKRPLLCVFNFSGKDWENYTLPVPTDGNYTVCFSSRIHRRSRYKAADGKLTLSLPRLSALFFSCPVPDDNSDDRSQNQK